MTRVSQKEHKLSDLLDRLTSRKFLLCIAGILYTLVQVGAGSITPQQGMESIQILIGAYVAAEGIADAAGRLKPSMPTDPAPQPEPPAEPATN